MKQILRSRGGLCPKPKPIIHPFYKLFITFTVVLVSCVCSRAQVSASSSEAGPAAGAVEGIKPLKIGDTIPDALWNLPLQLVKAGQEGSTTVTLNDYKGKLIILDFWATWCSSCIAVMPSLDSLQMEFYEQLKVIPVTEENEKKVLAFLTRKKLNLHSVINQTELRKTYFPYKMIPHQIWIFNGRVKAITPGKEATANNIKAVLSGNRNILLKEKKDVLDYDYTRHITDYANQKHAKTFFSSSLTHFIDGLGSSMGVLRAVNNKTNVINYVNSPLVRMYQRALNVANNRIVLDLKDKENYIINPREELKSKLYCYQLFIPAGTGREEAYRKIISDLNRYFKFEVISRRKLISCYVIKKAANEIVDHDPIYDKNEFRKYTFDVFVRMLNYSTLWSPDPPIYIDESGYNGSLILPRENYSLIDNKKLKDILSGYGFTVVKAQREMEMFVITDK